MSRILKSNLFFKNLNSTNFVKSYKNFYFLSKQKNYIYYDYFFFLINYSFDNFKFYYLILKNFFNFFNSLLFFKKNYIVLDSDFNYSSMFLSHLFNNYDLVKYNYFFKFNLKKLKYQHFFFLYKNFLEKFNVNLILFVDYNHFYMYVPYFNIMGVSTFSFINIFSKNVLLDYFFFSNKKLFFLEKIIFFSKILKLSNNSLLRLNNYYFFF